MRRGCGPALSNCGRCRRKQRMAESQCVEDRGGHETHRRLSRRNRWKTENRIVELNGEPVVVKDCAVLPEGYRSLVARRLLRREYGILKTLEDFYGAPHVRGWISPWAFAMQWVDAPSIGLLREISLPQVIRDRLCQCVADMHQFGVAHCDLHQANVLITPDHRVVFIDFATAICRDRVPAWLWRYGMHLDWVAAGKTCRMHWPERGDDEQDPWNQSPPFGYQALRSGLHRIFKRQEAL